MRFRFVAAVFCIFTVILLGGCSSKEEKPLESSALSQSYPPESTEAVASQHREAEEEVVSQRQESSEEEREPAGRLLIQQNSSAEEGYEPAIRLLEDGSFVFSAYCYDGVVSIQGSYQQEGEDYRLTPQTSSAPEGAVGSDLGEFRLIFEGEDFSYSGEGLGVTFDGAQFREKTE